MDGGLCNILDYWMVIELIFCCLYSSNIYLVLLKAVSAPRHSGELVWYIVSHLSLMAEHYTILISNVQYIYRVDLLYSDSVLSYFVKLLDAKWLEF